MAKTGSASGKKKYNVTCDKGYVPMPKQLTCNHDDKKWYNTSVTPATKVKKNAEGICKKASGTGVCPELQIKNGKMAKTGSASGKIKYTVKCDKGYVPKPKQLTCNHDDKKWYNTSGTVVKKNAEGICKKKGDKGDSAM